MGERDYQEQERVEELQRITVEDLRINLLRYYPDFATHLKDLGRVTLREYQRLMHASNLRQFDVEYQQHLQAWLDTVVQSIDKEGRAIYRKFSNFYDYEQRKRVFLGIEKPQTKAKMDKKEIALILKANATRKEGV